MEKKKKSLYKMFTKWTLSYVVLSLVAIGVIFLCALQYNQVLREELEYTNAVQLDLVQMQMDKNVRILRSYAGKANLNETVKEIRKMDSYEEVPRYELYGLVEELAENELVESGANDCYLYFTSLDLLMSGNYYNTSREYYDVAFDYGFSYEDWYETIHQDYRTAQIFSLDTKDGRPLAVLIKPLDSSGRNTPAVHAIMILDMNDIFKTSQWLNQDRDRMCIIDQVNHKVVSNAPLEEGVAESLLTMFEEGKPGPVGRQFEVESSAASAIRSQYEKWDYVMITGESAFAARIGDLQYLVVLLVLLYLAVSVIAIGYAATRHYFPLKKVLSVLQKQGGEEGEEEDAYEYLSRSVNRLVTQNRENTSVITRQRSAISRSLFHRLLTEKQAYAMLDGELLKQYGILVEGKHLCVLAYRMERQPEGAAEKNGVDAQKMSWFILQNVTEESLEKRGLSHLGFQESEREQVFLCWSEDEGRLLEGVEAALTGVMAFVREHFNIPYAAAVSETHAGGAGEIYLAYREVLSVFEYQKKEEGREAVSYRDINLLPRDTLLTYPIDAENRLIHSVATGNGEESLKEVRGLLSENQVSSLKPEVTQFLVSNIAASVLRAVGNAPDLSQKALMEAYRQGEPERMQEELERLVLEACRIMAEQQKKEKENQKGKLDLDVKVYVEAHYQDVDLSVNAMAEKFGVQSAYLSKVFKELEGEKLSQYIHKVRLAHVKELLKEDTRLEEIAALCGFGSHRTFLRIFKQYEGVTPTQWKELEEKKGKEGQDL